MFLEKHADLFRKRCRPFFKKIVIFSGPGKVVSIIIWKQFLLFPFFSLQILQIVLLFPDIPKV